MITRFALIIENLHLSLPYLFLLLIYLSIFTINSSKLRTEVLKPLIILIIIFLTLKYKLYLFDFKHYYIFFTQANWKKLAIMSYPEPSYYLLAIVFKYFNIGFDGFISLYYALLYSTLYMSMKKMSDIPELSFLLFILLPPFFLGFSIGIRQGAALGFFLLGISNLILEGKIRTIDFILLFISILFHYSSLLAVLITVIIIKMKKILTLKLQVFAIVFVLVTRPILFKLFYYVFRFLPLRYSVYLKDIGYNALRDFIYIAVYLIFIFFTKGTDFLKNRRNIISWNLFFVGIIINLLGSGNMSVNRFGSYFLIFVCIVFANFLKYPGIKYKSKLWAGSLIIVIAILYFIYGLFAPYKGGFLFLPYRISP